MPDVAIALGVFSTCTFFGSLLLLPVFFVRMPVEYFATAEPARAGERPLCRFARNALGTVLLLLGLLMLLLPGQGLLTLIVACGLIDCPPIRSWERRLVAAPGVLRTLNWMRARAGRAPFLMP